MTDTFDYFVVFAEMRTGSNFLEANLNAFPGLVCHGEAFNPHFIGYPNSSDILGVSQAQREATPQVLIESIKRHSDGLGGFRYFHDHDPRVLDLMLQDPRCAKIILTRNPVDSYVSWKIAKATGQWKLTNVKKRKDSQARFDREEFERHLAELQAFQVTLLNALQRAGQTAFYVAYEDLQDVGVMNGLAKWLGQPDELDGLDSKLKRQNPAPLSDKVENYPEMEKALAHLDQFNLTRTPNFEPRRGAVVPSYIGAAKTPLLFMPIRSGPDDIVAQWLADLDGVDTDQLTTAFSQKSLRFWKKDRPGFRSFTVIRHPVARIHRTFCDRILSTGPGSFTKIRKTLNKNFGLGLPDEIDDSYSAADHKAAFEVFLAFVKANLSGQTGVRVDASWASQAQTISGYSELAAPDLILREDELAEQLPSLARQLGIQDAPAPAQETSEDPVALDDIYDAGIEQMVSAIYQKDYVTFGFAPWR
ncbi:MAG: nodulation protein NodH [Thalassovita sp.]